MKTVRLLPFLFLLLIFPILLSAQGIVWQKLNGPPGGGGRVYPGKDGYIFTKVDGVALYRSHNGGQSWEKTPVNPLNSWYVTFSVGVDGDLYIAYSEKLYRSADNGMSWTQLNNNIYTGVTHDCIFGFAGGILLSSGYSQKIRRSTDNGQSWQVIMADTGNRIGEFVYNPATGDVYAIESYTGSNSGKLWRSSDQGQTWTVVLEAPGFQAHQIAFSPNGAIFVGATDLLWRSLDNGATWTSLDCFFADSYREISVAVSNTGRLFAFEWYVSKYSDDNGNTWFPLGNVVGDGYTDFSTDNAGHIFALRNQSLYVTSDNGATWNFAAYNILQSTVVKTVHIDATHLLALTVDALFYTKDGGTSWELVWNNIGDSYFFFFGNVLTLGQDGSWYLWDGVELVKFNNEGQTHTILTNPSGNTISFFSGMWYSPVSQSIFVSTEYGFFKSTDAGQTWTQPNNSTNIEHLIVMPDGTLLTNSFGDTRKSVDDGHTWTKISASPVTILGDNGLLYGVDYNQPDQLALLVSPDGGSTWSSTPIDPSIYPLTIMLINSVGHIFIYDNFYNTIYRSIDGGLTFNVITGTADYNASSGEGVTLGSSQYLYWNQAGDGIYRTSQPTSKVKLITGRVWQDTDADCNYLAPDTLLRGQLVKLTQGNETTYGYSNSLGSYFAGVNSGDYQVSVVPISDYWSSCTNSVNIPSGATIGVVDSVDIGISVLTECPLLTVSISSPFLRRCFDSDIFVQYQNKGTVPATNAYITIALDPTLEFISSSVPVAAQTGDTYTFLLGDVAVGASGGLNIKVKPSCFTALGTIYCVEAHIYPDAPCPILSKPHIVTRATCLGDSVQLKIDNIGAAAMSTPLNWKVINPENFGVPTFDALASGNFFLAAGGSFTTTLPSGYSELDFYANQSPEYKFNVISHTTIRGCGVAPGSTPLSIVNEDETGPSTDKFCRPTIGAFDPNDKQGLPAGLTDKGYIERNQILTYLIRFQNTGTDTAFNISVRDTLSVALDPGTVKLLNNSHPCEMRVMPNGSLLFLFEHIMLPDSNINEARSHGFVQFSVEQKSDNAIGTAIRNQAAIYFDFNAPVFTNTTLHTVGIPLVSGVDDIPASQSMLKIMPNPFKTDFTVAIDPSVPTQDLRLFLYDNSGKIVAEKAFSTHTATVPRGDLPSGAYRIVVRDAAGRLVGNGSVVAQ